MEKHKNYCQVILLCKCGTSEFKLRLAPSWFADADCIHLSMVKDDDDNTSDVAMVIDVKELKNAIKVIEAAEFK